MSKHEFLIVLHNGTNLTKTETNRITKEKKRKKERKNGFFTVQLQR